MHCTSTSLLKSVLLAPATRTSALPPSFLLPAFAITQQAVAFSTTPTQQARKDGNPNRGVSALRRTGLGKKQKLSVKLENLPKPVLDPALRSAVETDPNHGLWGFFPENRQPFRTPQESLAFGRPWSGPELRNKDWFDLHRLWWTCLKERNRIRTGEYERKRVANMYGEYEANERLKAVNKTMRAIRHTLLERWYAWESAREAAMEDEEVDLYADVEKGESAYLPKVGGQNDSTAFESEDSAAALPQPPPDATSRHEARV